MDLSLRPRWGKSAIWRMTIDPLEIFKATVVRGESFRNRTMICGLGVSRAATLAMPMLSTGDRGENWMVGYVYLKGGFQALRSAGIGELVRNLSEVLPQWKDRFEEHITDWKQCPLLSVESSRVPFG